MRLDIGRALQFGVVAWAMALSACSSLQTLEPVLAPPSQYQLDRTAAVEFVAADAIGERCAARGVRHAGACASRELITLPDPCEVRGDAYAEKLCGSVRARALAIAFVHPDLVGGRCEAGAGNGVVVCERADTIIVVNPCIHLERGWYAALACHELAHANGWEAGHRGGSLLAQPSFVKAQLDPADILSAEAVRMALLAKAGER